MPSGPRLRRGTHYLPLHAWAGATLHPPAPQPCVVRHIRSLLHTCQVAASNLLNFMATNDLCTWLCVADQTGTVTTIDISQLPDSPQDIRCRFTGTACRTEWTGWNCKPPPPPSGHSFRGG